MTEASSANPAADTGTHEAGLTALGALNVKTRKRQRMLLLGGGGSVALIALWTVFGSVGGGAPKADAPQRIETDGLVNRDLSQREFVAIYGNRLDAQARQLKTLEDTKGNPQALQTQLDALAAENQAMKADGARTIDALTAENKTLQTQMAEAQTAAVVALPSPSQGGANPGATDAASPDNIAATTCANDLKNAGPSRSSRISAIAGCTTNAIQKSTSSATSSSACSAASKTGAGSSPASTETSKTSWLPSPSLLPLSGGSNESGP